jgi:hypothetical protein
MITAAAMATSKIYCDGSSSLRKFKARPPSKSDVQQLDWVRTVHYILCVYTARVTKRSRSWVKKERDRQSVYPFPFLRSTAYDVENRTVIARISGLLLIRIGGPQVP